HDHAPLWERLGGSVYDEVERPKDEPAARVRELVGPDAPVVVVHRAAHEARLDQVAHLAARDGQVHAEAGGDVAERDGSAPLERTQEPEGGAGDVEVPRDADGRLALGAGELVE